MTANVPQAFQDTIIEPERVNRPPLRPWGMAILKKLARVDQKLARAETVPEGWLDTAGSMIQQLAVITRHLGLDEITARVLRLGLRAAHPPAGISATV